MGVQAGVLCLGMKTISNSGYLGPHSQPSTGSGTATDRSQRSETKHPHRLRKFAILHQKGLSGKGELRWTGMLEALSCTEAP